MAYAAVVSLLHTIDGLVNSSRISVAFSTRQMMKFSYASVESLRDALTKYDEIKNSSEGVMAADARIRDEARKLEDAIESHASIQFLSQSQSHDRLFLSLDQLRQDIDCFAQTAKKMGDEYIEELNKPFFEEEEDAAAAADAVISSATDSSGNECDMVGLSDQFLTIRDALIGNKSETTFALINGMPGIGKTTLAKKVLHDSLVKANFECRAFVRVGRNFLKKEILQAIIEQVNLDNNEMVMGEGEDLEKYFERSLTGRKYLIVLDDIWDDRLYVSLQFILPYQYNGSRILLISRIECRPTTAFGYNLHTYKMRFLNEEESWNLLRRNVFGEEEEECPPLLVIPGKKIAENCEGLPLLIVAVGQLLSKAQKNVPEYWNEVAEKQNSVFEDAYDQISEVLLPSYHNLTQYSKLSFLYMVAFPQKCIIQHSKIKNIMWAEGFRDLSHESLFQDLVSRNLVLVQRESSKFYYLSFDPMVKACSLHSAYWHLGKREAENNKVVHILNSYADGSVERVEGHRCLAVYKNVMFAIKEVHNSIASISTIRSLLCTGPYHQYQVPICLEWRLLRTFDALTIRFYEFPVEVVKLIMLRYLALTCNANLPRSISKLCNLQFLIVHQHLSIKRVVDESYVPVEIWDLRELEHLQLIGRNLPHPPPNTSLPKLTELLGVGVQSCTKGVLQSMPRLAKLNIQIELEPHAAQNLSFMEVNSPLNHLESLKAVIMNPKPMHEPIFPLPTLSNFTNFLKKLTLSGCGYPWKDMSKVAELSRLEVLKLKCYAFRGEKWEAKGNKASDLKYLFIEDTDLVQWTDGDGIFKWLSRLTMKNCHKLQEIPQLPYALIELIDCNPLTETCAKQRVIDAKRVDAKYSWK